MNKPYLTIGIPTYNRKEQIQSCVRSILPQLNDKVRLVVRDNASDYNLASLFTEEELSRFELQINPRNIGGDANILSILATCDTPWCWVIGDDDPLKIDSLSKVLKEIDANPDAAYINFCARFDRETHSFKEFTDLFGYRRVFNNSYFIAACIFNMDKLRESLYYYYKYQSSMIGQIIFVLKHLEQKDEKCLFRTDYLFSEHSSNIAWNLTDMVVSASILYYVFYDKRKLLNKSLFKGVTRAFLNRISRSSDSMKKKLHVTRIIMAHYGTLRTLFYCTWDLSLVLFRNCIPNRLKDRIRK